MRITCVDEDSYRQTLALLGVVEPLVGAFLASTFTVLHGGLSVTVERACPAPSFLRTS